LLVRLGLRRLRALLGSLALLARSLTGRLVVLRSVVSSFDLVFVSAFRRLAPLSLLIALSYGLSGGLALLLTPLIAIFGLFDFCFALMALIPGLSRGLAVLFTALRLPVAFAPLGLTLRLIFL
jgi:hypothetical protein